MLSDKSIKALKPQDKPRKASDEKGLYLLVTPAGGKLWRLKYRIAGKEKLLTLGQYPEITLAAARERAMEARRGLANGVDPATERKQAKALINEQAQHTFGKVALAWHKREAKRWAPRHAERVLHELKRDLFPNLEETPVSDIKTPALLRVVKGIEARGAMDVAGRAQQRLTSILRYAVQHGLIEHNPGLNLRGIIVKPPEKHRAAVRLEEVGELVQRIGEYEGRQPLTRLALKLTLLTFLRSTEIRGARWEEIDFEKRIWTVPAIRDKAQKDGGMKCRKEHFVPLSDQAIEVLKEIRALDLSSSLVFPIRAGSKTVMSENTMNHALNKIGYKGRQTVHGLRTVASTILNAGDRRHKWNKDAIERQLAHSPKSDNAVRDAYNRYEFLDERKEMMQWYAGRLEQLEASNQSQGVVVDLKRAA